MEVIGCDRRAGRPEAAGRHRRAQARPFQFLVILQVVLLAALALQAARFCWTIVAPLGPLGSWQRIVPAAPRRSAPVPGFDAFFRDRAASAPEVVSELDVKLHGFREDLATGRGSAIVSSGGGEQRNVTVGDTILPGVVLERVDADGVTILVEGRPQRLFLAQ